MDAFVTRKRRRISPPEDLYEDSGATDEESTDYKLSLLASLHPDLDHSTLLEALLACEGSVELASETLRQEAQASPRKRLVAGTGYQSSILSSLSTPDGGSSNKRSKFSRQLVKKGRTLHLYDPQEIEDLTPCSMIRNFLPPEEANALLRELLGEAEVSWKRATFQLFDRVVQSPHTTCFYVQGQDEAEQQKREFRYNGGYIQDIRPLTPEMQKVSLKVEKKVNEEIQRRIRERNPDGKKLKYQSPQRWIPTCAFANCYNGGEENVGYHTDQLTYLGPRAVIGSLSLGVTREFRVRRIVRKADTAQLNTSPVKGGNDDFAANPAEDEDPDAGGQIAIHLPHNSLLIMHAEMQEEWKHSIAPATAIDPHPVAGRKRINVTYRCYRDSLHPNFTPRCKCDIPTILRAVRSGYAWMCYGSYMPGKKGCDFFKRAEFDDDGEPPWASEDIGRGGKEVPT